MNPSEQLSAHFQAWEFRCPCGWCSGWGDETMEEEIRVTAEWLEKVRTVLGSHPVFISSGYRCRSHNAEVPGAASNSQHPYGRAADILVRHMSPRTVQRILSQHRDLVIGLGKYASWTHIDRRDGPPATWRG